MTRSLYKPDFISKDILRKIKTDQKDIKTRSRNTIITSEMMGKAFAVYNGHRFFKFNIENPDMIGHCLGEFCFTKRMGSFFT